MDLKEADFRKAKDQVANHLLRPGASGNVLGVGLGATRVNGKKTDFLRIYVESQEALSPQDAEITNASGLPMRFLKIGRLGRVGRLRGPLNQPKETRPGSIIKFDTCAPNVNQRASGTLGAVVKDEKGRRFILSCNHVLAMNGRVPSGTPIVQGAVAGIGVRAQRIATYIGQSYYVEIGDGTNRVDCALAALDQPDCEVLTRFPGVHVHQDLVDPKPGMEVQKIGGVTGPRYGVIRDVCADVRIDYSFGTFTFKDQILIEGRARQQGYEEFAFDGDSGSVVFETKTNRPTAMVIAEAGRYAVACPLSEVLNQLGDKIGSTLELDLKSTNRRPAAPRARIRKGSRALRPVGRHASRRQES